MSFSQETKDRIQGIGEKQATHEYIDWLVTKDSKVQPSSEEYMDPSISKKEVSLKTNRNIGHRGNTPRNARPHAASLIRSCSCLGHRYPAGCKIVGLICICLIISGITASTLLASVSKRGKCLNHL